MARNPRGSPAGIVFRRLDTDGDRHRAADLLPDCVLEDHDETCVWYGLCDLTAPETTGLAGVAVVRPLEPATARLCGLAISTAYPRGPLGRRLLRDVADRLRASGVEEVTAPPPVDDHVADLLGQVGFVAGRGPCQRRGPGWSSLPL
jgi:hypothetical protein